MKNNPMILIKHDHKKKNGPLELKRRLGALSTDTGNDNYLTKLETKPRSTSKSADKSINLNFSRSYLAPSQGHKR